MIKVAHTKERLQELLQYDGGRVFWRVGRSRAKAGSVAGSPIEDGRRRIQVDGHLYPEHHIAWMLHYGDWAPGKIDHINRDPSDNRIENLRLATTSLNNANRERVNKLGFRGVYRRRKGFTAIIRVEGRSTRLGQFSDPEAAARAYDLAAIATQGEFAILNFPAARQGDGGANG